MSDWRATDRDRELFLRELDGFVPDMLPELSMNPGRRGMQMQVRFREGAPVKADDPKHRDGVSGVYAA